MFDHFLFYEPSLLDNFFWGHGHYVIAVRHIEKSEHREKISDEDRRRKSGSGLSVPTWVPPKGASTEHHRIRAWSSVGAAVGEFPWLFKIPPIRNVRQNNNSANISDSHEAGDRKHFWNIKIGLIQRYKNKRGLSENVLDLPFAQIFCGSFFYSLGNIQFMRNKCVTISNLFRALTMFVVRASLDFIVHTPWIRNWHRNLLISCKDQVCFACSSSSLVY